MKNVNTTANFKALKTALRTAADPPLVLFSRDIHIGEAFLRGACEQGQRELRLPLGESWTAVRGAASWGRGLPANPHPSPAPAASGCAGDPCCCHLCDPSPGRVESKPASKSCPPLFPPTPYPPPPLLPPGAPIRSRGAPGPRSRWEPRRPGRGRSLQPFMRSGQQPGCEVAAACK